MGGGFKLSSGFEGKEGSINLGKRLGQTIAKIKADLDLEM